MLLVHSAEPRTPRQHNVAAIGAKLASDQLEQGRFADPVAADQAYLGVERQRDRRMVEEAPAPGVEHEIVNLQHGASSSLHEAELRALCCIAAEAHDGARRRGY